MIFTSEQVSNGHPDKICDQISDAIVTECLIQDPNSRVAVETLIKGYNIIIAGEVTTNAKVEHLTLIHEVLTNIGLDADAYTVTNLVEKQSADIALGVDKGGAGDQGIMFGYATNETKEMLPLPYVMATRALQKLEAINHPLLKADAKSQVTYDYEKERIDTFLISVQHDEKATNEQIRRIVVDIMKTVAVQHGQNIDFKILVNPTGRFVKGSSFADAGLTGRKIIADSYGGAARHGGGAFSGKDPSKVDRSCAYMARYVARQIVLNGWADKCEIQVGYAIGVAEPVSVHVETFGTEKVNVSTIENYVKDQDFRPRAIIVKLDLLNVDYNKTASYGHFIHDDMPWEK